MDNAEKVEQIKLTDHEAKSFNKSPTNFIFIFAIFIIVIISSFSVYQFYNLMRANRLVAHTYQVLMTTDEALYLITLMESRQRGYLLFDKKSFIDDFDETVSKISKSTESLKELTLNNPLQNARSTKLATLIDQRIKMLSTLIKMKDANKMSTPEALAAFNKGQVISEETKLAANEITENELVLLQERNAAAEKNSEITNLIFIVGQTISIAFLMISFILFNRELVIRRFTEIKANNIKSQLRSIIEEAHDMIAAVDLNLRFIIFNDAYKKEFESLFKKQIYVGMSIDDAISNAPDVKSQLLESWKQSLQGREYTKVVEYNADEKLNVYEVTSSLIKNEHHDLIGAVHIIRNISARAQKQNELKIAYENLNQGMSELKAKNEKISLLLEMSDVMLACNSTQELSNITVKFCGKVLSFSSGIFYLMNSKENFLEISATWGSPLSNTSEFTQDQCWALRLSHIHQAGLAADELICEHVKNSGHNDIIYLCVPLRAQNDIFGLLYIEVSMKDRIQKELNNDEVLLINAFAELAALALANARLRENLRYQAIRDPLTSLYNRRHLEEFISKQIHQSERTKSAVAILMIDIDHFKLINDNYGHSAGDIILKELGQLLLKDIRPGDIASRYGGEEFIIVFYNTDAKTAKERAEKIRNDVSQMKCKYEGKELGNITISIGISVYPGDGKSGAELIAVSDKALYLAKNSGRNKVVLFSDTKSE